MFVSVWGATEPSPSSESARGCRETAKLNGVEPFPRPEATLEAIAAGHSDDRIDGLVLWTFNPSLT